jgi:archaellum biogenesis ATPase FlaH
MNSYNDYLNGTVETIDPSRSGKDMALGCFLARKGLTPGEIFAILKSTVDTYNKGKILKEKYLKRTVVKAMDSVKKESKRGCGVESGAHQESPLIEGKALEGKVYSSTSTPALLSYSELKDYEIGDVETITTPLPFLNHYLAGGFGIGEITLLVAKQESGKTSLSCFLAAGIKKAGYNVLCVHYEDSLRSLKKRYNTLLKDDLLSDSDIYFVNALHYKTGLDEIRQAIRKSKATFVVVDYLARVPVNKALAESRFEIRDTMMGLKDIAAQEQCSILVTDHITISHSEGKNKYRITENRVAEAKMFKLMVVDYMIGLCKDDDTPGVLYATGLKAKREYRTMFQRFRVDWETAHFYV